MGEICDVMVIHQGEQPGFEEELAQDVLEIVTVFSARLYGSRSCAYRCGDGAAGIDLGLSTFATIACPDGTHRKVEAPEPIRRSMKALRRTQRKPSRRKPGSKNRGKVRTAVAKGHRRISNIRKDFLHKVTAEVAVVQVEGLSIKGWQRRWGRKTSDLAPAEFIRQLEYKLDWRGGELVTLPRHFPSSQVCHDCGSRAASFLWRQEGGPAGPAVPSRTGT